MNLDMIPATASEVAIELVKDKTAWIGSGMSFFATIAARDSFWPATLEAWLAIILTLCTITYVILKIRHVVKKGVEPTD